VRFFVHRKFHVVAGLRIVADSGRLLMRLFLEVGGFCMLSHNASVAETCSLLTSRLTLEHKGDVLRFLL
jgi:hypothetical protein